MGQRCDQVNSRSRSWSIGRTSTAGRGSNRHRATLSLLPKQIPSTDKLKARLVDPRLPPKFAKLVSHEVIDLTGASPFFMQQAECAALFTDGRREKGAGAIRAQITISLFLQSETQL